MTFWPSSGMKFPNWRMVVGLSPLTCSSKLKQEQKATGERRVVVAVLELSSYKCV